MDIVYIVIGVAVVLFGVAVLAGKAKWGMPSGVDSIDERIVRRYRVARAVVVFLLAALAFSVPFVEWGNRILFAILAIVVIDIVIRMVISADSRRR